jgi:hypothetical protein
VSKVYLILKETLKLIHDIPPFRCHPEFISGSIGMVTRTKEITKYFDCAQYLVILVEGDKK